MGLEINLFANTWYAFILFLAFANPLLYHHHHSDWRFPRSASRFVIAITANLVFIQDFNFIEQMLPYYQQGILLLSTGY